ncbi:MAG TPA: hypothetical protein V6C63_08890 [Allocoleopsis sp.]
MLLFIQGLIVGVLLGVGLTLGSLLLWLAVVSDRTQQEIGED